ncbi:MAG TPA: glycosyltransferase family 4 protein [Gemmatimonadaceae bacterium]
MARALTVLHIDTERGWRGGERQVFWLARAMLAAGHRPLVAARVGEPLAIRARTKGLEVVDCRPRGELDLRAAWRLRGVVSRMEVDVVHAHTAHAVTLGALALLGSSVPLVASRRVDFPLRRGPTSRWKYRRAARIIAVSSAVRRILVSGGIEESVIDVVPDGTDVHRRAEPASRDTLRQLGVPAGAPLVVQVAQLVSHKDPVNFVRAMRVVVDAIPSAHGLLVGEGPLRSAATAEVKTLGLEGHVHFGGFRDDADALLASADVACLSSREEGMGSVLLDSMVFGRPVAATTAGGIPEVVRDGETGLLAPPESPKALGEALVRLLKDADLRRRMAAAGKERAGEFSVERMAERTVAIYEEVILSAARP